MSDNAAPSGEDERIEIPEDKFNNPAFKGAFRKGALAAVNGEPRSSCPYDRDNYGSQGVTFSRAFWRKWMEGYDSHSGGNHAE